MFPSPNFFFASLRLFYSSKSAIRGRVLNGTSIFYVSILASFLCKNIFLMHPSHQYRKPGTGNRINPWQSAFFARFRHYSRVHLLLRGLLLTFVIAAGFTPPAGFVAHFRHCIWDMGVAPSGHGRHMGWPYSSFGAGKLKAYGLLV